MNSFVNRESIAMLTFADEAYNNASEFEDVCSRLKTELYEANDCMQDKSGQEAISIVSDLIEETMNIVGHIRFIAGQIRKSADLLEESDTLL